MTAILDDIFKCIFLQKNIPISIHIALKFAAKGQINNISALVKKMAWCQPGSKPFSEPMIFSLLVHICITWPQWVKQINDKWLTEVSNYY